jgi:hypothetical protein
VPLCWWSVCSRDELGGVYPSDDACDLVRRLLIVNPSARMGGAWDPRLGLWSRAVAVYLPLYTHATRTRSQLACPLWCELSGAACGRAVVEALEHPFFTSKRPPAAHSPVAHARLRQYAKQRRLFAMAVRPSTSRTHDALPDVCRVGARGMWWRPVARRASIGECIGCGCAVWMCVRVRVRGCVWLCGSAEVSLAAPSTVVSAGRSAAASGVPARFLCHTVKYDRRSLCHIPPLLLFAWLLAVPGPTGVSQATRLHNSRSLYPPSLRPSLRLV